MKAYKTHDNLLIQAAQYGIPLTSKEKSNGFALHDTINNHEQEQIELTNRISQLQVAKFEEESVRRAQEVISRLSKRVQEQTELSEWQVEVLDNAARYGIKYNLNNPDWFKLSDHIEELELLLPQAEHYGIWDWDANDLIDLKQKIEASEHKWCQERDSQYRDYLVSRI
jgi:hypothetical protein